MLSDDQCKYLYVRSGGYLTDYSGMRIPNSEWIRFWEVVRKMVKAKTDASAGNMIRKEMGPWDLSFTAVGFARKLRKLAAKKGYA